MSEPIALPPPEPPPEQPEPPVPPPSSHNLLPWLSGAGFLLLAAAIAWVWQHPAIPPPQTEALEQQIAALQAQVTRLEQRPQPQSPDLAPFEARVAALEQRPAPAPTPATDLGPLTARVSALEQVADRAARVVAARQALDAGHKLGNLPGAPPALARFADIDPPTEASLRLAFPAAARAALVASRPATDGQHFLARIWARAQDLVTIRQGDRVLVGDPAAGLLDRARKALDDGDLAGAVQAVAALTGPTAQAMADWLAKARALLDARAALATWAAQG